MDDETLKPQSWVRLPTGVSLEVNTGTEGATVRLKQGPLLHADALELPGMSSPSQ